MPNATRYECIRLMIFQPKNGPFYHITDGKKDHFSVGKSSIEYTRIAEDPYDGVMKLWEYTQKSDNPSGNVYVFKSTRSNDHITYDSMREILKI